MPGDQHDAERTRRTSSPGDESIKITTKKGFDVPIAGQPDQVVSIGKPVTRVAVLGTDYVDLKPKMLVEVGQAVGAGQALFRDKHDQHVVYTAPATGRIAAVNRGRRRVLQSVVIELDEAAAPETTFDPDKASSATDIRSLLVKSGAWTSFRTRPYNRVAHSEATPGSVFVTAADTRPLAPDPAIVAANSLEEFSAGIDVIRRLGDWPVYVCTAPNWTAPIERDGVQHVTFDGPHPSGLAGTHIHHLDPVSAERSVWHIGYQDVIAIGHLFRTGRLHRQRVVSIAGPCAQSPRLVSTHVGASLTEMLTDEVLPGIDCRPVSGSPLDGVTARGPSAFLGRYHNQVSLLQEKAERHVLGWFSTGAFGRRKPVSTTASHGRHAAMHPSPAFERVIPMDILPVPLLRAILVKDTDSAQALGCLELAEEDLALSSFVCPGKQDYGAALRLNLKQIAKDG